MIMPMVKKHSIRDYWAKDSITYLPVFGKYLSRDRYQLLLRYLHFNDNIDGNVSMFKIRPVFDNLMSKFKELFLPKQKLVIDELLVLVRGSISFREYIKQKDINLH